MTRVQKRLKTLQESWDALQGQPYAQILRRTLLRDFARFLHAERSRKIQKNAQETPDELRDLDKKVDHLLEVELASRTFDALFANPWTLPRVPRHISQGILQSLGPEKFSRFDRKWEQQMVCDAIHGMWTFWNLDAWIEVLKAETFHEKLAKGLWPVAVVLFTESAPGGLEKPLLRTDRPLWKGRWVIACSKNPAQLSWNPRKEDGLDTEFDPPVWSPIVGK